MRRGDHARHGVQLTYPIAASCFTGPGTISPQAQDRRRKDTYTEQWSASTQRELPADFVGMRLRLRRLGSLDRLSVEVQDSGRRGSRHPYLWDRQLKDCLQNMQPSARFQR